MKSFSCSPFYPALLSVILFFSACSGKSDNNAVIIAMQESLEISNASIFANSKQILHSLDEKSRDYPTKVKAGIWFPKAQQIQKLSEEIYYYIEELKKTNTVNAETAHNLYLRLMKHKADIFSVDSSIRQVFDKKFILISGSIDTGKQTGNDFYRTFFRNSSAMLTSAMLTKIQNNIRTLENKTITFCHENISVHDFIDYLPEALVCQNSKYIKAGEKIEITAGIASFSNRIKPVITINRKNIELKETGLAVYSFKAPDKPGKHYLPVKFEYSDVDGKKLIREFTVDYTVAKECDQ